MVRFTGDELNLVHIRTTDIAGIAAGCRHSQTTSASRTIHTLGAGACEVDDSVPRAHGGTEYLCKLVPACVQSNESKGDLISSKFTGRGIR